MYVKQISVFLENSKGTLARMTRLLGEAGLDLIALSIADTEQYGIMRCIVSDPELAASVMREAGYVLRITDVLAVSVPDAPGGLAAVLALFNAADVSVEYLYSFVRNTGDHALIILRMDDNEKAARVLAEGDVEMLSQEKVSAL